MIMFYSIIDNQTNELKSFAFNQKTLKDVKTALVEYLLLGNFSNEEENSIKKNSLEELCNYYEFTLIKSKTKMETRN